jgi:hypothetical protein
VTSSQGGLFDDGLLSFWCSFSLFLYLLDILFRTSLKLVRVYSTIPAGVTIKSHTHTSENPSKICVGGYLAPLPKSCWLGWTGLDWGVTG